MYPLCSDYQTHNAYIIIQLPLLLVVLGVLSIDNHVLSTNMFLSGFHAFIHVLRYNTSSFLLLLIHHSSLSPSHSHQPLCFMQVLYLCPHVYVWVWDSMSLARTIDMCKIKFRILLWRLLGSSRLVSQQHWLPSVQDLSGVIHFLRRLYLIPPMAGSEKLRVISYSTHWYASHWHTGEDNHD